MDIGGFVGPMFFMMIFSKPGSSLTFISVVTILIVNVTFSDTIRKSGKTSWSGEEPVWLRNQNNRLKDR